MAMPAAAVRFDSQLGVHALQLLFDGRRAGAHNVGNVTADFPLDDPVKHFGLAGGQLEAQAHGFDHGFLADFTHHDQPVDAAATVGRVIGSLVQPECQALRTQLDRQAGRLDLAPGVDQMAPQASSGRLRNRRGRSAVVALEQVPRQRPLPD